MSGRHSRSPVAHLAGALTTVLVLAGPGRAQTLELEADFLHASPEGDYHTALGGTLPFAFEVTIAGQLATATFALDRPASALAVSWYPEGAAASVGPMEVWMTDVAIGAADLDGYLGGIDMVDPSLAVAVVPFEPEAGGDGIWWRNAEPFAARLFVRGCYLSSVARYADLYFDSGELFVRQRIVDATPVIEVSSGDIDLADIDQLTWSFITEACPGDGDALSATPYPGVPVLFHGTTAGAPPPPPPLATRPYLALLDLEGDLAELTALARLRPPDAQFLAPALEGAKDALRRGRSAFAVERLEDFVARLGRLERRQRLAPEDAAPLREKAQASIDVIGVIVAEPLPTSPVPDAYCAPPDPLPVCADAAACAHTPFHVRQRAGSGGDGSAKRPFATLEEALAAAALTGACGVEIRLGSGSYPGDIDVDRHLRIVGDGDARPVLTGSIANTGGHTVVLERVRLSGSDGERGAIFADHPCAMTILRDVAVIAAAGYGLRQRGGALTLFESAISLTRASDPDNRLSGTALVVSCGAQVRLWGVRLVGNESGGVTAVGSDTRVSATELEVRATGVHPIWYATKPADYAWGLGALQSLAGAHIEATFYSLHDNLVVGAWASHGGSLALVNGQIVGTRWIDEGTWAALSLAAFAGGDVTSAVFEIRDSDTCGVTVGPEDGEVDLAHGIVRDHPVGACVQVEYYDLSRLGEDVFYVDNVLNLYALTYPPPGSPDGLEEVVGP